MWLDIFEMQKHSLISFMPLIELTITGQRICLDGIKIKNKSELTLVDFFQGKFAFDTTQEIEISHSETNGAKS